MNENCLSVDKNIIDGHQTHVNESEATLSLLYPIKP